MSNHEMAYTMAYTVNRRDYGTGSVLQRCESRYGCPPLVDGVRPKHNCKGRWYGIVEAGFTANGTRRRITVSDKNKTIAKNKLRDKQLELDKAGVANTRRTVTVAKWSEEWVAAIETKIRPSSLETDKAAVRWIVKTIGHIKLADLTPRDVRSVAAAIRTAGQSSTTALRYHGPLIRLLKAAAIEGYNIPPNVLLEPPPIAAVNDRQAIPLPQAIAVLRHLTRREDGALILPGSSRWSLAFLQGIRQAEALGLMWENVDLEAETLTIQWQAKSLRYRDRANPAAGFLVPDGYEAKPLIGSTHLVRPKSSAGWRRMPLIPWSVSALADWRENAPENAHGLVWPGRTTKAGTWPRNPSGDRDEFDAIQEAAKVAHPSGRPYHVHEIRHTTATLLMALKVPESIRIAIMGHSMISTTRGYEHVDIDQQREALTRVGELLELT